MSIARKILMGSSGGKKSTYVDDVFSTYLYTGTGSAKTINNGIDLSGEGGLVWTKGRYSNNHQLFDTARGTGKTLYTDGNWAEWVYSTTLTAYNNNGFTLGSYSGLNGSGNDYASWSFRKAPGFFDVVTYTGTGSNRTIAHNLGSVPGCIMVKRTDAAANWMVYHRNAGGSNPGGWTYLFLNTNAGAANATSVWNDTDPTSSVFSVGTDAYVNANGGTYVAYIFAGGASTAATARSVTFNQNYIKSGSTSDYTMGTGDFTVECWWKPNETPNQGIFQISDGGNGLSNSNWENTIAAAHNGNNWVTYGGNGNGDSADYPVRTGQWYHVAYVKTGGSHKLYVNGIQVITRSDSTNYYGTTVAIGGYYSTGYTNRGEISNFRITKGQALYTSSFKPPTAPLTTTSQGATASNVKLLCCNDASVTGSTVTGATISVGSGSPAASTNSPFDDLEGYKFGEDEDQNIIKCGYYEGVPGYPVNFKVELGWEPQFFIVKNIGSGTNEWLMWDSMRGVVAQIDPNTGGNDARLSPTESAAEYSGDDQIEFHPTGVRVTTNDGRVNGGTGAKLVYIAIRRPDGLVGKPALAGTGTFAMDVAGSTSPAFDSGFPIDFALVKNPAGSAHWDVGARLIQGYNLRTNQNAAEFSYSSNMFDYSGSWLDNTSYNGNQSWMWKRHSGFDVVTYTGNGSGGTKISHSLNKSPEMIWIKNRTTGNNTGDWMVGHKDLYAGSSPWNGYLVLNKAQQEYADQKPFYNVAPTFVEFTLDGWDRVNHNGSCYIAMLFASVDGISKVGSYTGSSSELTITTGFSPRFVIIKNRTNTGNNWTTGWFTFDTTRGWAAGNNDKRMRLNDTAAQTTEDWTNPISTGFTINANSGNQLNNNGEGYVYYAHA